MHVMTKAAEGPAPVVAAEFAAPLIRVSERRRTDHATGPLQSSASLVLSSYPPPRLVSTVPRVLREHCFKNGSVAFSSRQDRTQPHHQRRKRPLLFVVIAIADPSPTRVAPDLRCQEQKPQPCGRQCRVLHRIDRSRLLAIEQHQPAVQVVR